MASMHVIGWVAAGIAALIAILGVFFRHLPPIGAGKQDHGAQAPLGTTDPRLRETAARGW